MKSIRELFGKKPKVKKPLPPSFGKMARVNRQLHLQIKAVNKYYSENKTESPRPVDADLYFEPLRIIASSLSESLTALEEGNTQIQSRTNELDICIKQIMLLQSSVNTLCTETNQAVTKLKDGFDGLNKDSKEKQNTSIADSWIRLYTQNALRQKDKGDSPEIYAVQMQIEAELRMMDVTMHASVPGTPFDPHTMEAAHCEFVPTNKKEFENTVAESVVPAFRMGGAEGFIIQHEQVALFKYDEHVISISSIDEGHLPLSSITRNVVGFLAWRLDDDIKAIYEVYEGSNVFGTNPREEQGRHSQRIPVKEGMEKEHFEIFDNKARLLSGVWNIDYLGNNADNEVDIYNRMSIVLSEHLSFVYYEK